MKKLYILPLAAALLGFTACSSDDSVVPETVNEGKTIAELEGGYMTFSINLPTQTSTRAANDVFDDGGDAEYAVHDATLYLFTGKSGGVEDDAILHSQYTLANSFSLVGTTTDSITSTIQITQSTDTATSALKGADALYALVVVNNNGVIINSGTGQNITNGKTTFGNLKNTIVEIKADSTKGLFMTNAPLSDAAYSSATTPKITTLATVDKNKIYASEADAQANPATEIFVERGMAKVTMEQSNNLSLKVDSISYDANGNATATSITLTPTLSAWKLDLTNTKSYIVRHDSIVGMNWYSLQSSKETGFRFIGTNKLKNSYYRTYWGKDPNYGYVDNVLKTISTSEVDGQFGTNYAQYCMENTFPVENMTQDNTTRVVLKVTYKDNDSPVGDIYCIEGEHAKIYAESGVKGYVLNKLANTLGKSYADVDTTTVNISTTNGKSTASATYTDSNSKSNSKKTQVTVNIEKYTGGVAYYPIRIKHFGDDLTPWNAGETPTPTSGTTIAEIYPSSNRDANYLGRYGVLRNNWYDISVTKITKIGSPDIPERPNTPDDELDSYISVNINVLSWARRTQQAEL